MQILHITPYYAPAYALGGVVRAVEGMAQALVHRGHRVTILTTDALNQHGTRIVNHDELLDGIHVIRVPNISTWLRGRYNLSTPWGMRSIAKKILHDVDIVHAHEFRTLENLLITPIAQRQNIPIVLSPHGTLATHTGQSALKRLWDSTLSRYVAPRMRDVVALTDHEENDCRALWQVIAPQSTHTRFHIVPNGVDLRAFEALPNVQTYRQKWNLGDSRVILFLGRLHPRKGADKLLQAFLRANIPNTRLLIAGPDDGLLTNLRQNADNRVVFTGYIEGQDRLGALAVADVFVLPAMGEGLSMATLEAMACGVPVIISPECYLPIVAQVGAGMIVEPHLDDLSHALTQMFAEDEKRAMMGQKARQLVENYFTWDKVATALEAIYTMH